MYLRRDSECRMMACFLTTEAMVAMFIPAVIVAVVNTALTLKMVWKIHQHRKKRNRWLGNYCQVFTLQSILINCNLCCSSDIKIKEEIFFIMKNTLHLSLMLGLTWIMAAFPTSVVQQYLSVILNGLTGVYIFVFTGLAKRKTGAKPKKKIGTKTEKKTSSHASSENTLTTGTGEGSSHANSSWSECKKLGDIIMPDPENIKRHHQRKTQKSDTPT